LQPASEGPAERGSLPFPMASVRGDILLVLALCPAIAVADTLAGSIGLGVAALIVAVASNVVTSFVCRWLPDEARLAATFVITAAIVAAVEMLMNAWLHELWESLAVFLPVLAVNLVIIANANVCRGTVAALVDGARTGGVIAGALIILGTVRELVGRGSFLHDVAHLLGSGAREVTLFRVDMGFLLAMLPPGAFIALALLIALRNWLALRRGVAGDGGRI
jgi:Na+-translocating ferredoxin:NAD+ oxidoreductase subunit E